MAYTPPTLVSYTETAWNSAGTGDTKSLQVTFQTGDLILVMSGCEAADVFDLPTATGLTFSEVVTTNGVVGTCSSYIWKATAGSST